MPRLSARAQEEGARGGEGKQGGESQRSSGRCAETRGRAGSKGVYALTGKRATEGEGREGRRDESESKGELAGVASPGRGSSLVLRLCDRIEEGAGDGDGGSGGAERGELVPEDEDGGKDDADALDRVCDRVGDRRDLVQRDEGNLPAGGGLLW